MSKSAEYWDLKKFNGTKWNMIWVDHEIFDQIGYAKYLENKFFSIKLIIYCRWFQFLCIGFLRCSRRNMCDSISLNQFKNIKLEILIIDSNSEWQKFNKCILTTLLDSIRLCLFKRTALRHSNCFRKIYQQTNSNQV